MGRRSRRLIRESEDLSEYFYFACEFFLACKKGTSLEEHGIFYSVFVEQPGIPESILINNRSGFFCAYSTIFSGPLLHYCPKGGLMNTVSAQPHPDPWALQRKPFFHSSRQDIDGMYESTSACPQMVFSNSHHRNAAMPS